MSDSVRDYLTETLVPLFPEGWRWVAYQRNIDALDSVTVQWKQLRIERLPEAPQGTIRVDGTLTIISPHQDIERSEKQLDEQVLNLTGAIDRLALLSWTGGRKVAVQSSESSPIHMGWDIDLWTTVSA